MGELKNLHDQFNRLKGENTAARNHREMPYRYSTEILEKSREGICVVQDGRIQYINPALQRMVGYLPEVWPIEPPPIRDFIDPDERSNALNRYGRFIGGGEQEICFETVLRHREGRRVEVEFRLCRMADDGEGQATLTFVRDITEQKRKESLLTESETCFRFLMENMSDIIVVLDENGTITYESPSAKKITGYPSGYFVGRSPFPFIHADDLAAVQGAFQDLIAFRHGDLRIPFRFRKADGSWVYLDALGNNLLHSPGIRGLVVTCQDITARKESQERLEQNLSTIRSLINAMDHAALLLDRKGGILAANNTTARYLGRPAEQLIGMKISDFLSSESIEKWGDRVRRFNEKEGPGRFFEKSRGRDYELSFHPIPDAEGRITQVAYFGYDVTEHKLVEEALKRSRREWMIIFQAIGHPTVILDPEQRILQANQAVCWILGMSEAELIGKRCYEVFHTPGEQPPENCPLRQMLVSGRMETVEMEMAALGGDFIVSCTPVLDEGGRLQKIIHIATDITERKQAELKLEEERGFLRQVLDAVPSFIVVRDAEGRYRLANRSLAKAQGTTVDRIIGQKTEDFDPNQDEVRKFQEDNLTVIRSREEMFIPEEKVTFKDRSVRWLSKHKLPLLDQNGACDRVLIVSTDITYLKKAEEEKIFLEKQLLQVQKMEAVGTLAGGIAHDFNNILMGVQGYISLLLYDLQRGHPHRVKLEKVENYIRRGADLTKQLLGFARGGKYDVKPTNMNELLGNSADLFGRTRKEVSIYRSFAEDLWSVEVDQGQMDQVFLNLFINASQAMPGGGNLELKTENVVFSRDVHLAGVTEGRYAKISVGDDGIGMDDKTLERVFEPFFTTKAKGVGTGLGLASVYGIVKNHGGAIHVSSEPGKGTAFDIYLPASENRPSVAEKPEEEILTGRETILVVDDEQINISVMIEMLEMLHYRVLPAGSGQEAIAVYMEKGGEIDLVMLDMIMPGISGGRTFDILKEINPEIDVILASGYSSDGAARKIINRGCRGFIQKPFQLQELSRKIREVLDNKGRFVG